MAPQMAWPSEPQAYDEIEYSERKEPSLYSSGVKSGDDFLPPDGLTVNFKHDLHRGLKSRQIAMVCFPVNAISLTPSDCYRRSNWDWSHYRDRR